MMEGVLWAIALACLIAWLRNKHLRATEMPKPPCAHCGEPIGVVIYEWDCCSYSCMLAKRE